MTHYLHNYKNGKKKQFQKDTLKALKQFIEYKQQKEKLLMVAEEKVTDKKLKKKKKND